MRRKTHNAYMTNNTLTTDRRTGGRTDHRQSVTVAQRALRSVRGQRDQLNSYLNANSNR